MGYFKKFYNLTYQKALGCLERAVFKEDINPEAKNREKIVLFYQNNGLKLTQEAFEVKRSTLFLWQKKYSEFGIIGLINGDRSPKQKRQSSIREEIKDFIKQYRNKYGNIHQDEIKPHLDKYCNEKGLKTTSVASIGRIIRELKNKGELDYGTINYKLNGKTGNLREFKAKTIEKERRKGYKPESPGDLLQADSIHLNIDGKKRYLINAIDIKGRFAFSYEYERLNSINATDFFEKLRQYCPFEIRRIQTDNGSEFGGYAHDYLTANKLTHFYNYPHSPKSNAHIERFNRTIKEQFVYRNEYCIADCEVANQKLKEYIFWYNTKRFHRALNYQTPLHYTLSLLNP